MIRSTLRSRRVGDGLLSILPNPLTRIELPSAPVQPSSNNSNNSQNSPRR